LRIPILIASAAALSLAGCGNQAAQSNTATPQTASPESLQWNGGLEKQLMEALDDAPSHGLTKDLFLKGPLPADDSQRGRELTRIAMEYASALALGKVDPMKLGRVYTVPRPKVDVAAGLRQAAEQKELRDWLNSLAPQTDEYRALGKAFVALVKRSPDLPDGEIPSGKAIKRGSTDPRVAAIAANLQALGYLPPELASTSTYTPAIAQAVARFQSDSGQKADGVIGNSTIAALNSSPRDRARTLAVAMERLRWLERSPPVTRIDVNTAATFLDYFRDGQHVDRRKVIAGQPGWETPQLGAPIFQLVANPTWTVPESIVKEEIAEKGSGWLARNNFSQKDGRWVQGSGPKNSLGIVKFDMKDDEAIYLHDTPAKAIFGMDERHRSHGCVRVEDAIGFAHMLAQADGIDDKFSKAMATGKETFVDLNKDIPVRLMYHTAYLGDDGRVHFAEDIYGWDNDVATALGYESRAPAKRKPQAEDVGP
jgi:murein L,D-transpeptidase YcbB/YkuD